MNPQVNAENLNSVMEFGSVVRINPDGTAEVRPELSERTPEEMIVVIFDEDGQCTPGVNAEILSEIPNGWSPMRGYSGQQGSGRESFIMHQSETISGGLASDILETPGLYVSVMIDGMPDDDDSETSPVGWIVVKRNADVCGECSHWITEGETSPTWHAPECSQYAAR